MKNVLVINNDFDTMSLLQSWLSKKGYTVKYTGDAGAVPAMLKEFSPGVVIVDVLQREVAEHLKTFKGKHNFQVLLMTGYAIRSQKNYLPVDDTIEKPFNLALLEEKMNTLMVKSKI